jgi:hypothetical protein
LPGPSKSFLFSFLQNPAQGFFQIVLKQYILFFIFLFSIKGAKIFVKKVLKRPIPDFRMEAANKGKIANFNDAFASRLPSVSIFILMNFEVKGDWKRDNRNKGNFFFYINLKRS